jgi:diguanylate cyclase (GGDEF)-like protein
LALISLRKHIDGYIDASRHPVADPAMGAFRASLLAIAECGSRALPSLGPDLNQKLTGIEAGLARPVAPDRIDAAAREAQAELSAWAGRAIDLQAENEREMKEIISALSRAAESVSARDEKYSLEIGGMSGTLRGIASLSDLATVRRSIMESAAVLKSSVEKMAEESRQSVRQLSAEVKEYRTRLEASERLCSTDALTELANRRAFEKHLQARIAAGKPFGLILIDLNGFKAINDRYGHLAGDDLLRQFSAELRSQFTTVDVAARWGGDEFAVLVTGGRGRIEEQAERIRRWVLGEYRIGSAEPAIRTQVSASLGSVEWNGSETGTDLVARADALVYEAKQKSR